MDEGQSLTSALAAVKRAGEKAKDIVEAAPGESIRSLALDVQSQLLSVQELVLTAIQEQVEQTEQRRRLEEDLARSSQWEKTRETYRLQNLGMGAFVYAPDPPEEGSSHWLCARCFEDRRRSVLQYRGRAPYKQEHIYGCPNCNSIIRVGVKPLDVAGR